MFQKLNQEVENLIDEAIQLSYFMRGAITYESLLERTPGERQRIAGFIERRLEVELKKSFPNY